MEMGWFDTAVSVRTEKIGHIRNVSSTLEAAEMLLRRWPRQDGAKLEEAKKACLMVMEGNKVPKHARMAFEAAAREADILQAD